LKVQLTEEAKRDFVRNLLERTIVQFKIEDAEIIRDGKYENSPLFIGKEIKIQRNYTSLLGKTHIEEETKSIKYISIEANDVPYKHLFEDNGWNKIKVKSHEEKYDDGAIFIAEELDKLGIDIILIINNLEKIKNLKNPSTR